MKYTHFEDDRRIDGALAPGHRELAALVEAIEQITYVSDGKIRIGIWEDTPLDPETYKLPDALKRARERLEP